MFIEVTPANKDNAEDPPVTINFADVRSFYYDKQIGATILRFFDGSRSNLPIAEDLESIQESLGNVSSFASARNHFRARRDAKSKKGDSKISLGTAV